MPDTTLIEGNHVEQELISQQHEVTSDARIVEKEVPEIQQRVQNLYRGNCSCEIGDS